MDFSSEEIQDQLELQYLPTQDQIKDHYRIGKQISSFGNGQVRLCISRDTEIKRAVKILAKNQMSDDEILTLFKQVRILKELDHPNIVKIYDFFEDSKRYYVVIDICKGGELFDFIVQKGQLSEQETALLMKQLLTCANFCHQNGIMHRDMKPENIVLQNPGSVESIKIVNFEISTKFKKDVPLTEKIGTPYYIAPEVLERKYGPKCDVWSCGIIAYICLYGKAPFEGASDMEILKKVKKGRFSLRQNMEVKDEVSDAAKDFLLALLTSCPCSRPTAQEALRHPWLDLANKQIEKTLQNGSAFKALTNLRNFEKGSKFKMIICDFIANKLLTDDEKSEINKIFQAIDVNGDGLLQKSEVTAGYEKYFDKKIDPEEIDEMFDKVDVDGSGEIGYSEFVVATMNDHNQIPREKLCFAFKLFDLDGGGSISFEEVSNILKATNPLVDPKEMFKHLDINGDGEVNFDEFVDVMQSLR